MWTSVHKDTGLPGIPGKRQSLEELWHHLKETGMKEPLPRFLVAAVSPFKAG